MGPTSIPEEESLPAKLSRPRLERVYPRIRLFEALSGIGDQGAVWITGPAGSGKTTAVNSFLHNRQFPSLWCSLDEGDSDIASFFYYLRWAVKVHSPPGAALPPALTPDYFPSFSVYAKRFFETAFALFPPPFVFVLDDYHEIAAESPLHDIICSAISQSPKGIRLYLLSREAPPPELARPWANCRLYLIGWEHLRLVPAETRGIAREITGKEMGDQAIADLHRKTDGWVAGLILLLRRGELEGIEPQLLSKHTPREIFDYFGSEIFNKLPPGVRDQMLQLAFLPKISADAARRITGSDEAEALLQRLHHGNAFLNRLVGEEVFYRFHPLLRDFLQTRARRTHSPEILSNLLRRSADILVEEGDYEEGLRLYIDAGELDQGVALMLSKAPVLAGQGRFRTLEKLIDHLPRSLTDDSPWLIYWRAVCRLPYAVGTGGDLSKTEALRGNFIKAMTLFEQDDNQVGSHLALAGILESISMGMENFALLDPWIAKYDELQSRWGPVPHPEAMIWVTPAVICALVMRQPDHVRLPDLIEQGLEIVKIRPKAAVDIRIFLPVSILRILQGDLIAAENLLDRFRREAGRNGSPFGTLVFLGLDAFLAILQGRFDDAVRIADIAHGVEKQSGMHWMYPHVHGAIGSISRGEAQQADRYIRRVLPHLGGYGNWDLSLFHTISGWISLIKGDPPLVGYHASEGLKAGHLAGNPLTLPVNHLLCALSSHLDGDTEEADAHLETAMEMAVKFNAPQVAFGCHLVRAEQALWGGEQDRLNRALIDAFRLGRKNRYVNTYFWRPDVMATLCVEGMKRGIEVGYVRFLVKQRRLIPDASPRNLEEWPWPLKIRTFGGFSVEIEGSPLTFTGKAKRRPLSLLKYLLAAGGHEISDIRIQDDLWPDSDGDRAANAFKTTLHRLRKLLGEWEAIHFDAGHLSLDPRQCWTDVWLFSDLLREAEAALTAEDPAPREIIRLARRIIGLYQGPFLPDEEAHWAIQTRSVYTSRFVHLLLRCTRLLSENGAVETAIELLNKARSAAPLEEPLTYYLMKLLVETGNISEAVSVYDQYRAQAPPEPDLSPSSRIHSLYRAVKNKSFY